MFRVSLVRNLLDVPGVSRRQFSDTFRTLVLQVSPEFLRIVRIVRIAETFHKFPLVLLGNALVPKTADIQPNLVGWCHRTRLAPYFRGSHEKSVVASGKFSALEIPVAAGLDVFMACRSSTLSES